MVCVHSLAFVSIFWPNKHALWQEHEFIDADFYCFILFRHCDFVRACVSFFVCVSGHHFHKNDLKIVQAVWFFVCLQFAICIHSVTRLLLAYSITAFLHKHVGHTQQFIDPMNKLGNRLNWKQMVKSIKIPWFVAAVATAAHSQDDANDDVGNGDQTRRKMN